MTEKLPPLLSDSDIDLIANDGMRNAAGGIYATSVCEFARACIAADRAALLEALMPLVKTLEDEAFAYGVEYAAARHVPGAVVDRSLVDAASAAIVALFTKGTK